MTEPVLEKLDPADWVSTTEAARRLAEWKVAGHPFTIRASSIAILAKYRYMVQSDLFRAVKQRGRWRVYYPGLLAWAVEWGTEHAKNATVHCSVCRSPFHTKVWHRNEPRAS